jgi:phage terminase Nu1 subunit (DNA packaging protein)
MKPALPRGEFMAAEIIIVDRGRGKQSSTVAEIQFLRQYIADHLQEVADEDRRIRERNATLRNPPEVMEILHSARRERRARMAAKEPGSNGAHHPG